MRDDRWPLRTAAADRVRRLGATARRRGREWMAKPARSRWPAMPPAVWTAGYGRQHASGTVLAGDEVGFRIERYDGATPVGRIVIRLDGRWVEPGEARACELGDSPSADTAQVRSGTPIRNRLSSGST
jgi:hypothetical protein